MCLTRVVMFMLCSSWLAGSACGNSPMSSSGPGIDAAVTPDGRTADAGTRPDAGSGAGFVSNTPGAIVVDVGNPATPNAVLLSSNVLQEPSGGEIFQQWLAEVKNTGSTVICQVSVNVSFQDASGTQIASFFTFADADPYALTGLSLSVGCLAPGQIGGLYDNGFVATAAQLSAVTRIEVGFSVHEYPSVAPALHAPLVTSHAATLFGTEFGVVGTLTGVGGPIYNIGLDAYPRAASGLVLAQLFATDLDTLAPGATFSFTTISTPSAFTEYRQFVEFIDGPKPAAVPEPALARAATEIDAVRREHRRAIRDRVARARLVPRTPDRESAGAAVTSSVQHAVTTSR